ncbi:uncharacterized protein A4U43_UnF2910 [Asparagus officinalis]|uniref:Uncharacterized protein n=1 Tax=Asparagus officinalis TaxID=4686 RepID=A0A1R3L759_ASPOF|nr:uncharacterized protein LOC109827327 [Asparagus officinalis]ONK55467.1 uncharacterized protein A4U43_UnF2910 [Asparagus officinalis]
MKDIQDHHIKSIKDEDHQVESVEEKQDNQTKSIEQVEEKEQDNQTKSIERVEEKEQNLTENIKEVEDRHGDQTESIQDKHGDQTEGVEVKQMQISSINRFARKSLANVSDERFFSFGNDDEVFKGVSGSFESMSGIEEESAYAESEVMEAKEDVPVDQHGDENKEEGEARGKDSTDFKETEKEPEGTTTEEKNV